MKKLPLFLTALSILASAVPLTGCIQFARLDVGDVDLRAVAVLVLVSRVARPDGDEVGVAAEVEDHRVARAVGVRRRQLHRELQRLVDLFVFA